MPVQACRADILGRVEWLEVALTVDGELAEAAAEVFSRYAPNGVMTEQGVRHLDEEDAGTADGPVIVRAYLPVDEHLEASRAGIEQGLHFLGMIQPLPAPQYRRIADQNWMEAWKQHYRPIEVGQRLVVVPAWLKEDFPQKVQVRIDPGMAFGTGTHPSTQLCLELLERESLHGRDHLTSIIDVGCGSGILSIAALKLGARSALGVDIDQESVANSRANAELNSIGSELELGLGSVAEVRNGNFSVRAAPIVLANILAPVIIRLFDAGLADIISPGGSLILAGILAEQGNRVKDAASAFGLTVDTERHRGDWVAFTVRKR